MSEQNQSIESVLKSVGLSSSSIERIKLGNGVVGKMTSSQMGLYVICFAGIGGGIWLENYTMILGFGAVAVVSFLFSSVASMWYATKYPGVALLEGAELVKYHQIEMAARDIVPEVQENTLPPVLEQIGGDGG